MGGRRSSSSSSSSMLVAAASAAPELHLHASYHEEAMWTKTPSTKSIVSLAIEDHVQRSLMSSSTTRHRSPLNLLPPESGGADNGRRAGGGWSLLSPSCINLLLLVVVLLAVSALVGPVHPCRLWHQRSTRVSSSAKGRFVSALCAAMNAASLSIAAAVGAALSLVPLSAETAEAAATAAAEAASPLIATVLSFIAATVETAEATAKAAAGEEAEAEAAAAAATTTATSSSTAASLSNARPTKSVVVRKRGITNGNDDDDNIDDNDIDDDGGAVCSQLTDDTGPETPTTVSSAPTEKTSHQRNRRHDDGRYDESTMDRSKGDKGGEKEGGSSGRKTPTFSNQMSLHHHPLHPNAVSSSLGDAIPVIPLSGGTDCATLPPVGFIAATRSEDISMLHENDQQHASAASWMTPWQVASSQKGNASIEQQHQSRTVTDTLKFSKWGNDSGSGTVGSGEGKDALEGGRRSRSLFSAERVRRLSRAGENGNGINVSVVAAERRINKKRHNPSLAASVPVVRPRTRSLSPGGRCVISAPASRSAPDSPSRFHKRGRRKTTGTAAAAAKTTTMKFRSVSATKERVRAGSGSASAIASPLFAPGIGWTTANKSRSSLNSTRKESPSTLISELKKSSSWSERENTKKSPSRNNNVDDEAKSEQHANHSGIQIRNVCTIGSPLRKRSLFDESASKQQMSGASFVRGSPNSNCSNNVAASLLNVDGGCEQIVENVRRIQAEREEMQAELENRALQLEALASGSGGGVGNLRYELEWARKELERARSNLVHAETERDDALKRLKDAEAIAHEMQAKMNATSTEMDILHAKNNELCSVVETMAAERVEASETLRLLREKEEECAATEARLGAVSSEMGRLEEQHDRAMRDLKQKHEQDLEEMRFENRVMRGRMLALAESMHAEVNLAVVVGSSSYPNVIDDECSLADPVVVRALLEDRDEKINDMEAKLAAAEEERKMLHNHIQELQGNIRVFVRVRPFVSSIDDLRSNVQVSTPISLCLDNKMIAIKDQAKNEDVRFAFDRVFGPSAGQDDVFDEVSGLVQSAIDGYNVCVFSYGQTGSGKTHTMLGYGDGEMRGLIPRAAENVLEQTAALYAQRWKFHLKASFLEIYNETLRDLLTDSNPTKLIIRKDEDGKTYVDGLSCVDIDTSDERVAMDQLSAVMAVAARTRSVTMTRINEMSSRSHSIFMLDILGYNVDTGTIVNGSLNLCDLAGSERLQKSRIDIALDPKHLKEMQAINKSLSSLGDVFNALATGSAHVPYRNSKLTYLLQDCFNGDGKALMIVNLSPAMQSSKESLCSLKFAQRVNTIELGRAVKHIKQGQKGMKR